MTPATPAEVLELWRAAWPERLPHPRGLVERVQDTEDHLWRRDSGGRLIAFAAFRPPEQHPYGYLRLVLVHPAHRRQGLGSALVQEVRGHLGHVPLAVGEETGHFFPGAPPETLPFFERVRFKPTGGVCVDMACNLGGELPPAPLPPDLRLADAREVGVLDGVLRLTGAVFSPRWKAEAHSVGQRAPEQVLALLQGAAVVGFAVTGLETDPAVRASFLYPDSLRQATGAGGLVGGLGPIGIHPDMRGSGLGRAFMLGCMHHLQARGAQAMGIDWTGIAPFYEKLGFRTWAQYHHLRG